MKGNVIGNNVSTNPGAANYLTARTIRITSFTRNFKPTKQDVLTDLNNGLPVIIRLGLPDNFPGLDDKTPRNSPTIPLPVPDSPGSGHFMLLVGYDNSKQAAIVLNSWDKTWGTGGYSYLPYAYLSPKWLEAFTIGGITVSNKPAPSIGKLSDLVSGSTTSRPGQVEIDTAASSASGTATSFDFFSQTNGKQFVTPLLLTKNAQAGTYSVADIGASFEPKPGQGSQGIPFFSVINAGASVTTNTVLAFYDGQIIVNANKSLTAKPNAGLIPFSATKGPSIWLTSTRPLETSDLKNDQITFSTSTTTTGAIQLTKAPGNYSAMLNE